MSGIFWSEPPPPPPPSTDWGNVILFLFFFWVFIMVLQGEDDDGNGSNRKNKKNKNKNAKEKSILDEVVGLEGVKEEIKYYMDFINNKKKYSKWEVKLPKGILLAGPPGTGKTLLG